MTEVYVLVERKKSTLMRVVTAAVLAIGILFALFSMIAPLFLSGALILLVVWYFFLFRSSKES